jgi:hypothetical protein
MIALLLGLALLGGFGLVLTGLGLVFARKNAGFNRRAVEVTGVVVGHREHLSTAQAIHRRIHFPTVRYRVPGGPELEASAPGEDQPLPLGHTLQLLVDPGAPEQVSFTGPRGGAGVAYALAGAGCLTLLTAASGLVGLLGLFAFAS